MQEDKFERNTLSIHLFVQYRKQARDMQEDSYETGMAYNQ